MFALCNEEEKLATLTKPIRWSIECWLTLWPGNKFDLSPKSRAVLWCLDGPIRLYYTANICGGKGSTYKLHQDCDLVFEWLVVSNFSFLHCFHSHHHTYAWLKIIKPTCLFVSCQIHSPIATRAEFLFKEILVFDVSLPRLNKPSLVKLHNSRFILLASFFALCFVDHYRI